MGASCFVELADKSYNEKNFVDSEKYYRSAFQSKGSIPIIKAKAELGLGMSLVQEGKFAEGEECLSRVFSNKNYPAVVRGNAQYLLAQSHYYRGNIASAKSCLNELINSPFKEGWESEARRLLNEISQ